MPGVGKFWNTTSQFPQPQHCCHTSLKMKGRQMFRAQCISAFPLLLVVPTFIISKQIKKRRKKNPPTLSQQANKKESSLLSYFFLVNLFYLVERLICLLRVEMELVFSGTVSPGRTCGVETLQTRESECGGCEQSLEKILDKS